MGSTNNPQYTPPMYVGTSHWLRAFGGLSVSLKLEWSWNCPLFLPAAQPATTPLLACTQICRLALPLLLTAGPPWCHPVPLLYRFLQFLWFCQHCQPGCCCSSCCRSVLLPAVISNTTVLWGHPVLPSRAMCYHHWTDWQFLSLLFLQPRFQCYPPSTLTAPVLILYQFVNFLLFCI